MEKQRIFFIDYIKAFSITLIIVSHCIGWFSVNDVVNKAILSIHVPIFFIAIGVLKGYLQREEELGAFIKKRSRQLLIPYFWFSIYNSAVKLSMMAIGVGGGVLSAQVLKEEAVAFFITGNGTVWFLMTLLLAESLFVWIKSYNKDWMLALSALLLVGVPYLLSNEMPILIVANRFMSAYFYIVLGFFVARLMLKYKRMIMPAGLLLLVAWICMVYKSSWSFSFFDGSFHHFIPTTITIICGGVGFILLFSLLNKHYGWLEYVGKNSLILMLMHPTFLLIGIYGLYPHLHIHSNVGFLLFSLALIVFVYGLSLLCVPIIHCYFPFLIGEKRVK